MKIGILEIILLASIRQGNVGAKAFKSVQSFAANADKS